MGARPARLTLAVALVLAGVTAVLSSVASAASTPTITITNPQPCFVDTSTGGLTTPSIEHRAIIDVTGAGWNPGSKIRVSFAGIDEVEKRAGAGGTFTATFAVPDPSLGFENTSADGFGPVTATDTGNPDGSDPGGATATSRAVTYADRVVDVWEDVQDVYGASSDFAWNDKVFFKASGFSPGKPIYAHYVLDGATYAGAGKLITTVDLGKASGPCGSLTRRATVFPFAPPLADDGDYTIHYSSSRSYSARTSEDAWIFNLS